MIIENPNRKSQVNLFKELAFQSIHRTGISDLITFCEESDFFIAPASTKYHGAYVGGLLDHSLEVYYQALRLCNSFGYEIGKDGNNESLTIVSLFHDLCKTNSYTQEEKNVKNEETGLWEKQTVWKYNEKGNTFGAHGASSLYHIQNFIRLTEDEASAIYHHMGQWDASKYDNLSFVYEYNRLAWILHVADEAATYIAHI